MYTLQRNTARESYHNIYELGEKQREVLGVIRRNQPVCNKDIARILGWEINCVTGRVNELEKLGHVVESHRALCPVTGKRVRYLKLKEGDSQIGLF